MRTASSTWPALPYAEMSEVYVVPVGCSQSREGRRHKTGQAISTERRQPRRWCQTQLGRVAPPAWVGPGMLRRAPTWTPSASMRS